MSRDPAQVKKEIRAAVRAAASGMNPARAAELSKAVRARLAAWEPYRSAKTVMMYIALPGEADLGPLATEAWAGKKKVCVPRTDWVGRGIVPALVNTFEGLKAGRHGLMEPAGDVPEIPVGELDLVLVPGLAFDTSGRRLGRGAGFYDRFLANPVLSARTCGVCFESQVVPALPSEEWDVRVKAVATEGRLIELR